MTYMAGVRIIFPYREASTCYMLMVAGDRRKKWMEPRAKYL